MYLNFIELLNLKLIIFHLSKYAQAAPTPLKGRKSLSEEKSQFSYWGSLMQAWSIDNLCLLNFT